MSMGAKLQFRKAIAYMVWLQARMVNKKECLSGSDGEMKSG